MLRPAYPITTERLLLRPFVAADLDAFVAIHGRPEVVRFLYWEVRDRDELRGVLTEKMARTELVREGDGLNLAATLRSTGELVGDLSLTWTSAASRQGEVGYILSPGHQGHGYATEAARVMLRIGFEALGLHRVYGRIEARNAPSGRVLERLGMRREAHFVENEWVKGEWNDEVVYAMLDREWEAALRA